MKTSYDFIDLISNMSDSCTTACKVLTTNHMTMLLNVSPSERATLHEVFIKYFVVLTS
jgi:hypothetical protein